jgi:predicted PurR-regulated permease PerM
MSQPKLSQTALFEVLVSEFESIKNTKGEFNKILTQINTYLIRLEELYNKPIFVDIKDMREEHERIKETLARGLYFPKWLVITSLSFFLAFSISLFFNYQMYFTNKKQRTYIERAISYIEELEGKIPKNKNKK